MRKRELGDVNSPLTLKPFAFRHILTALSFQKTFLSPTFDPAFWGSEVIDLRHLGMAALKGPLRLRIAGVTTVPSFIEPLP